MKQNLGWLEAHKERRIMRLTCLKGTTPPAAWRSILELATTVHSSDLVLFSHAYSSSCNGISKDQKSPALAKVDTCDPLFRVWQHTVPSTG